ncbi:hypothetical protein [Streptomyces sp. NBC_00847]|uniref:hypothetical protein n=1 Tax=Streptomyces sp. NBC_00847 TaxID=2975850 RepID=UPI00224E5983|nr:hypothetical protein [Streptomyces sp. NBC_00847]MCX4878938.1 hypothetical protein [Streptomyces sp. NBC_00847]
MPNDRPWHRRQPNDVPDADIRGMTDARIREFCLDKAKLFLSEARLRSGDTLDTTAGTNLTIAAHYATIAAAFGRNSEPEPEPEREPEDERR